MTKSKQRTIVVSKRMQICASVVSTLFAVGTLAGCSSSSAPSRFSPFAKQDPSSSYSPRVVNHGTPVPKGGGRYKLGAPYRIKGRLYIPKREPHYNKVGIASWYGDKFHGRLTANGEVYDMNALTAAHPTLPLPSLVRVTNVANGRYVIVRVNDRGPYARNRIIDLSKRTADLLKLKHAGTGAVRVQYLGPAPLNGDDRVERRSAMKLMRRRPYGYMGLGRR